MYRRTAVMIVLLGAALQNVAADQKKVAAAVRAASPVIPLAPVSIHNVAVNPSTISFTATDPDLGNFSGSSPATVTWQTNGGVNSHPWTLGVAASTPNFSSCATVPLSAIKVSCSNVTGGNTPGTCAAPIQLSTALTTIASGKGDTGVNSPYSVTINFTLADSWRYIAEQSPPCTLNVTYTINAQ